MDTGQPLGDAELVSLVDRITEERFLGFVEGFVAENAQYFDDDAATSGEDHKLFQTEIHGRYQRLFESRVEAWLAERGCTLDSFLAAVARGGNGLAADIAEELFAVADFGHFVAMMHAHRVRLQQEAAGRK
mmetsp:Transcript_62931/g.177494  ORF Transcript_62931/g.177494 Transcript_62931/m.177494 type:complete len:131 (+) Transcript_62931:63-455(+)